MTSGILDAPLTDCDLEPIHVPGSIQPHGAMLVVDARSATIVFASTNICEYLGNDCGTLIGETLPTVLGAEVAHAIGNAAARAGTDHRNGVLLNMGLRSGKLAEITMHQFEGRTFLEFEPAASSLDSEIALTLTQALVRRIDKETDVDKLVASVAKLARAALGYDRVMVYRFLENGAGRVVAEAKTPDMGSFLHQHFPFSDIPVQARALYLKNWIRVIGDSSFDPVPLYPPLERGTVPIDMSFSHLRSVSPVHCEYLRNMGVASSMSVSVVVDGTLWGLIACHHNSPKVLSAPLRVATELFAQYFSLQISAAEARAVKLATALTRQRLDTLVEEIAKDDAVGTSIQHRLRDFLPLVPSDASGTELSPHDVNVQADAEAYRMDYGVFHARMEDRNFAKVMVRSIEAFSIQLAYTAISNAIHEINERLARWLLMCHDRLPGDEIRLTHDYLAVMLAVRRPSVTTALHVLEGNGFIRSNRGVITIRNRASLEEFASDAYGKPEAEYQRLMKGLFT